MAEDNHTQMLIQQQPNAQQQPQLQPNQLQQSQLQQSQMQQSQLQQSQLQQSQLQQSQLQQSQLQQSQLQHSQLQQSQIQQSQLQQQPQMQQQAAMQQQTQQQAVAATMSLGSSVEQSNMNVTTSMPINVATINVSQPQQMQALQQTVNTSSGTPVQMAVNQLTAQAQTLPAGTMISQSSAPHATMMHPTMTMAQAPLQQVQVIQQPLSASYLQHLYSPQQQMLFPGNLTLQHAGMGTPTLQSLGGQGLSLQLQAKATLDPKTSVGQSIQAVNTANKGMAVNAGTMMTASGQVISASPKANFPQQMMTGPGKSTIIHSQSGFAPNNANQTVVIGQLGVLPNQQSIFNHKTIADSQKGKTYTFQNQPTALQPKSLYSSTLPVHSSAQVFNGSHLKQISSQPQIITTQAPGTMFSQAQLLGLQALSSLPPGLSFATPGCLQSTALLGQNPIIIRSQQSDMFIQQSQPQAAMHHLPVAAATQPVPPTSFASTAVTPLKQPKPVKVRPGIQTQTVAVATQTNVSTSATVNANTIPVRTQIRPKVRLSAVPAPVTAPTPAVPQMATTQTQTNQSPPQTQIQPSVQVKSDTQPPVQQKSDAGNQTYQGKPPSVEMKSSGTQNKSVSMETKLPSSPQKSQAMVAPSAKITPAPASTLCVTIATPTSTLTTVSSTTSVMTNTKVLVNTSVSTTEATSSAVPSISSVLPVPKVEVKVDPVPEPRKPLSVLPCEPVANTIPTEPPPPPPPTVAVENEHLKPQQPILKPSLGQVKDKQPQKAIVKPQVLTHVIDGFVIQEGPEPFPVSRSALLDSPCRVLPSDKPDSLQKRKEPPTVASPEKKMKVHRARGNVELAKCEFCGKMGPKSKFKRSKRFCSTTCVKRFNVCKSKRTGLLPSAIQEHVAAGPGRKKKMGFRGRKSLRKMIEDESMEVSQVEENTSAPDDESTVSNKTEEENSEPPIDSPHPMNVDTEKDELEGLKTDSEVSQKLPTKWSVQDVFEFIRDLPGCSDYADTFKSQEIDGQALLLLKEDHLMTAMCMKLGPALKLMSQIKSMKEEVGPS